MKNHIIEGVRRQTRYHMRFVVLPSGTAGGLCLWWNDNMKINVLSSSRNLIHTEMREQGKAD